MREFTSPVDSHEASHKPTTAVSGLVGLDYKQKSNGGELCGVVRVRSRISVTLLHAPIRCFVTLTTQELERALAYEFVS